MLGEKKERFHDNAVINWVDQTMTAHWRFISGQKPSKDKSVCINSNNTFDKSSYGSYLFFLSIMKLKVYCIV